MYRSLKYIIHGCFQKIGVKIPLFLDGLSFLNGKKKLFFFMDDLGGNCSPQPQSPPDAELLAAPLASQQAAAFPTVEL